MTALIHPCLPRRRLQLCSGARIIIVAAAIVVITTFQQHGSHSLRSPLCDCASAPMMTFNALQGKLGPGDKSWICEAKDLPRAPVSQWPNRDMNPVWPKTLLALDSACDFRKAGGPCLQGEWRSRESLAAEGSMRQKSREAKVKPITGGQGCPSSFQARSKSKFMRFRRPPWSQFLPFPLILPSFLCLN